MLDLETMLQNSHTDTAYRAAREIAEPAEIRHHETLMRRIGRFSRNAGSITCFLKKYVLLEQYRTAEDVKTARRTLDRIEKALQPFTDAINHCRSYEHAGWFNSYGRVFEQHQRVMSILAFARRTADHLCLRLRAYQTNEVAKTQDHPDQQLYLMINELNPRLNSLRANHSSRLVRWWKVRQLAAAYAKIGATQMAAQCKELANPAAQINFADKAQIVPADNGPQSTTALTESLCNYYVQTIAPQAGKERGTYALPEARSRAEQLVQGVLTLHSIQDYPKAHLTSLMDTFVECCTDVLRGKEG